MAKKETKVTLGNKEITFESGRLAKQADGSVLVSCEGTQVLVTVCSAKEPKEGQDFFPLTVDYTEKFYSAGKFLGGFMKREGRPTTGETLTSRLIDRPLRPLFPEGYMNDTFVQATVLSYKEGGDPEVLASMGAAVAVSTSDIPFHGLFGTVKVGRIDGNLVINPEKSEWAKSDLEVLISASSEAILMVEGEAEQVSEEEMLKALLFGHDEIKKYIATVGPTFKEWGKTKREFIPATPNTKLKDWISQTFSSDARNCLSVSDKLERQDAVAALIKKVKKQLEADPSVGGLDEKASFGKESYNAVDELLYVMMRKDIIEEEKRIAGRKLDEVRDIAVEVDVLSRPHGSALFTRGETQVVGIATIGSGNGSQKMDRISGMEESMFYLHYAFPPFCVGDARGIRGVSRRELGHGNLAERAIKAVIPSQEDFPYCIRLNCEVLESNGSSSMGSVCSGSMALMDAGVPLKKPVAGIAMGLIKEGDKFKILSDILGDEDHLGDMDFKVAGTDAGITAIQMDIKITGITAEIMENAMTQAKAGRLHILNEMSNGITTHRELMKEGVPRMETLKIPKDKIGALIGPGGKNIKGFQEKYDVEIECLEDGTVKLVGTSSEELTELAATINLQINGPKPGTDFKGTVVSLKEYGAFVDIATNVSGLLHISEFSDDRVNDAEEYLAVGDIIDVRVTEVDKMGRLKLSAKAVKSLEKKS